MRLRSHGLLVGPVRRVLGGRAHRELVHVGLAEHHQCRRRAAARRWSRRTAAASPRGSSSRRWSGTPLVAITSLTAIGTPASGPSVSPAAAARVDRPGRRERALGVDVQERVHPVVDGGDPVEVRRGDLDGGGLAARRSARRARAAVILVRSRHGSRLLVQDPRHAEPALGRRPARRTAPRSWVRHGLHDVVAQHVGQRHGVRGRRDVGGGDLADPGDRLEDHVELAGELVQLLAR